MNSQVKGIILIVLFLSIILWLIKVEDIPRPWDTALGILTIGGFIGWCIYWGTGRKRSQ